jgi:hypothetical protein
MKLLYYVVCALVLPVLTLAAQLIDRARMDPLQRQRVFLPATWGAALLYVPVPCLSMIPWVWVTRQEWPTWRQRGLGYATLRCLGVLAAGVIAAAAVFGCFYVVALGCAWVLGVSADE